MKAGTVIQVTPTRRLISYPYGWRIEKFHITEKKPEGVWTEDEPAYPSNLRKGLYMLCDRLIADRGDTDPSGVIEGLEYALKAFEEYEICCDEIGKEIENEITKQEAVS